MLEPNIWEEIYAHAKADYPLICCGFVTEDTEGVSAVHRCRNIQDRLHKDDPIKYPRTAETAFRMDDSEAEEILNKTYQSNGNLTGIYYSNCDCEAYLSEETRRAAIIFDEPAYPGVTYAIVSVIDGEVEGQAEYKWDDQAQDFVEQSPRHSALCEGTSQPVHPRSTPQHQGPTKLRSEEPPEREKIQFKPYIGTAISWALITTFLGWVAFYKIPNLLSQGVFVVLSLYLLGIWMAQARNDAKGYGRHMVDPIADSFATYAFVIYLVGAIVVGGGFWVVVIWKLIGTWW